MENEIFIDIPGFEGLYQVSNYGRIKSLKFGKEKIMKPRPDKKKYLHVSLFKNKEIKGFTIHRLVAATFIPNPNNYPQVNHIDEDKSNNSVQNLEWCSVKYNNNYGTRIERVSESNRKKVDQFTLSGEFVRTWNSITEVERTLGIANSSISSCCKGRIKSAGNFIWKYH